MSAPAKFNTQDFANKSGEYKRKDSSFRGVISSSGPHLPEANRYHLYFSYACPWAHRTLITRALKGLTGIISASAVHWHMDPEGWRFGSEGDMPEGVEEDPLYGFKRLSQVYFKAEPQYGGRYTVPVLWDKKLGTIVNNESSEIIRMLSTEFNDLIDDKYKSIDIYPTDLQSEIESYHEWIYPTINNGVYKAGFATKQEPYEKEVTAVFASLDRLEKILADIHAKGGQYLVGDVLTEVDIRLFTTLIRFDPVYHQHFKCNIKMIRHDYPEIHKYMKNLYWNHEAFKSTTNFEHIKFHYTKSHPNINPYGITPLGPVPNIMPL